LENVPPFGRLSWRFTQLPRPLKSDSLIEFHFTGRTGVAAAGIPLLWAALHVVKALMSTWGGVKSDRWGRRVVIGAGWLVYAVVYGGFALSSSVPALVAWFMVYGVYYGLSEGTEKALVTDLTPPALRGTAFGIYNGALGFGSLLASVVFGLVWKLVSPAAAFVQGQVIHVNGGAFLG
jgi:MFS family permease